MTLFAQIWADGCDLDRFLDPNYPDLRICRDLSLEHVVLFTFFSSPFCETKKLCFLGKKGQGIAKMVGDVLF